MNVSNSYSNNVTSLHEAIQKGDIDKVKSLLSKLRFDKHYLDANNNSAPAVAIKLKKHEIYELLVSKGIFLGPHEWMDEATSGQERSLKINLREIHKKYFNDPSLKHLMNLITTTKLSHEASPSDQREHLRFITEAFEDLNGLKSIEPILKVASTSPKLRIVFDFNRDSVEFLDPVQDRNVMGVCYTKDCIIYVGAKDLKRDKEEDKEKDKKVKIKIPLLKSSDDASTPSEAPSNRYEVLGHLIHELTHFVMELVYGNEAKPYQHGNQKKLDEFSQVVNKTAAKKKSEPYIDIVYDYPEIHHHAELIVRVPHLTALYKDDEEKTIEVHQKFSELFDFYEKNILADLKQEFPLMEVKHEIRELNELCGTLAVLEESDIEMSSQALVGLNLNSLSNDKILFISSNCPQLTLSAIYQQVRADVNFMTSFIFADLKSMRNAKIFDLVGKAIGLSTHPRLIIDCHGDVKFDAVMEIARKLKETKINQKVIFILDKSFVASSDVNVFKMVHSWNHLTSDFQQKLLQKKVEFHGTEIAIKELLNDLSSFESIPFQDLLNDQTIVIGRNHKFETEKLIDRKCLPSNSKKIHDSEDYTIERDLNEVLTFTRKHQTILISDEPGMGKSTSLQMLHLKLRQKNPSLWHVFIDLKENFEAYQISCLEVRNCENIANFFTEKVLKIESFDAQVFFQLFVEGRVVLLMDGLDEICPSYKQFIFSLMKDIQKFSKNQLWISTRPHLVNELKKELNPIVLNLKPFTKANRREFFEKHFSGDQNSELKLKEIEIFLINLKVNFWDRDVCNPLVMRMIVEILDEDQNLKLSKANLFLIYDRFTKKMIKKCLDRGQEAEKDILNSYGNSNIVEFYHQQAFLTCFGDRNIFAYENSGERRAMRETFIAHQFEHVCRPPLDEIVRVGLMYASSSENLNFIHRTFAEFYVAKFFYEVIFKSTNQRPEKYLNQTIEFLLEFVLNEESYEFIIILIENALDSEKLTVKKFPPSTLQVMQDKIKRIHFEILVRGGFYNLIEFIVLHLYPDRQTLLFSNDNNNCNLLLNAVEYQSVEFIKRFFDLFKDLNADEFKKIIFVRGKLNHNIFHFAALNPNSEVFKFINNFCESLITKEELNELLMQTNKFGETVLHSAVRYNRKVDIIIEILTQKLSLSQQKTLLEELTDNDNCTLLQYAVKMNNSVENFESLIALMKKVLNSKDIENFLLHEDRKGCNAFDFALMSRNELVFGVIKNFYLEVFGGEKMREIMFIRNNCENLIQNVSSAHFIWLCLDGVFKRFFLFAKELSAADSSQKYFVQIKYEDWEIFLMFAVMALRKCNFATVCSLFKTNDRVEILQQKNSRGECAFHWAVEGNNFKIFCKVRKLYEESFDKQNLRKIIASCDKSWILDVIEKDDDKNSETFKELCHYLKELFKGTEESEMLKAFFLFADASGKTAFMAAARGENKEFEQFFALAKELYTIETVKEFLLIKDANGATAFRYSLETSLNYSFEYVKSVFEELFEREKMQEIVLTKDQRNNILFHSISHPFSVHI